MAAVLRALDVLFGIQQAKHNPPADKNLPATVLHLPGEKRMNTRKSPPDYVRRARATCLAARSGK
jgi:hypothetical protein